MAKEQLVRDAVLGGYHVLFDIVGASVESVQSSIDFCAQQRFKVYLVLNDLPSCIALGRVWARFQKNPFGRLSKSDPGRYVPMHVVSNTGDKPKRTFDAMKTHKAISGYLEIDAGMPMGSGSAAIREDRWGR